MKIKRGVTMGIGIFFTALSLVAYLFHDFFFSIFGPTASGLGPNIGSGISMLAFCGLLLFSGVVLFLIGVFSEKV